MTRKVIISQILLIIMSIFSADTPPETYKVFLPVIISSEPKYGLAMAHPEYYEDIDKLDVSWWYDWSDGNFGKPGYIPMLWRGNISSKIPQDYAGYILVFNEPNLPSQSNLSVEEAVKRYKEVRNYYKFAKLVVGGTSIFATDYLEEFINDLKRDNFPLPDYYHVHAYIEDWINLNYIKAQIEKYYKITGGNIWITEFNTVYPHADNEFLEGLKYLDSLDYVKRIAVYTNRQLDSDYIAGWALCGCDLVNPDGSLTNKGTLYRNFIRGVR